MKLNDKYFHSIHPYVDPYDDVQAGLKMKLMKLDRIFESGAILSNERIKQKYKDTFSHPYKNVNGKCHVSISKYKGAESNRDKEYKKTVSPQHFEDAFESFVLQEPSIVLDSKIKEDLIIHNCGIYLERLVLNEIPLKYMRAIAVFSYGRIKPFFTKINSDEYEECYNDNFYKNCISLEELDSIRNLLNKYGYNVPIVDIMTGNEYEENLKYREYIASQRLDMQNIKKY